MTQHCFHSSLQLQEKERERETHREIEECHTSSVTVEMGDQMSIARLIGFQDQVQSESEIVWIIDPGSAYISIYQA